MAYTNTLSQYRISDGWNEHLARGSRGGIDYAVGMNTPIPAPCNGRLENRADNGNGYGNYIRFHHGDGFVDEYLHLNTFVAEGNYSAGQVIGYSGSTGNSTGPHIHHHLINPSGTRVNPLDYMDGGTGVSSLPAINASAATCQQVLANVGLYTGPIDGVFGPKSWTAAQTWLAKYGLYAGPIDGVPGPKTYKGVQLYGQKNGNYAPPGVIDGVLGPLSWAGFAQSLKEDTVPPAPAPAPKPTSAPAPAPKPEVTPKPTPTPKPVKPAPSKPSNPVKEKDVKTIAPLPESATTAGTDSLGILIPNPKARRLAYALYGLAALVISNASVAVMASGTEAPVWLIVVSAIVGNLAVPFTTLAIANATSKK